MTDRECNTEGCPNLVPPWDVLCPECWGPEPTQDEWDETRKQVRR